MNKGFQRPRWEPGPGDNLGRVAHQTSSRVTLRGPWLIVGWFLALLWTLLGLVVAIEQDPVAVVLGSGIAAVSIYVAVRLPFMRVTAAESGLTSHGLLRTRRVQREDVLDIALERTDDKLIGQVYAPVLRLRGDGDVVLVQLSGYSTSKRVSNSRVARQTQRLRHALEHDG